MIVVSIDYKNGDIAVGNLIVDGAVLVLLRTTRRNECVVDPIFENV